MSTLLPFIVAGVTAGSVYGLAGVGLVLTYKTSGIFNFAHGALATVAAYVFYAMHVQRGVPWPIAGIVCLLLLGLGLGTGFEAFARYVARAPLVWQVVGTLGVLLIVEAVCDIVYGADSRPYPHFLPTSTFRLLGANVTWESLIIVVVSVVLTGGLYAFFRIGRAGKAMRAVVDDPDLLGLAGTSPTAIRRYAWIIGTTLAVLSGQLLAPSISLQASTLTLLCRRHSLVRDPGWLLSDRYPGLYLLDKHFLLPAGPLRHRGDHGGPGPPVRGPRGDKAPTGPLRRPQSARRRRGAITGRHPGCGTRAHQSHGSRVAGNHRGVRRPRRRF